MPTHALMLGMDGSQHRFASVDLTDGAIADFSAEDLGLANTSLWGLEFGAETQQTREYNAGVSFLPDSGSEVELIRPDRKSVV